MSHDEIRESLGAYILDALSPEEHAEVEAHLRTCAECSEEVASLSGVGNSLALLAEERDPPPGLRLRLMAIVEHEAAEWRAQQADRALEEPKLPTSHDDPEQLVMPPAATIRPGPLALAPAPERTAGTQLLPWRGRMGGRARGVYTAAGMLVAAAAALLVVVFLQRRDDVTVLHQYACAAATHRLGSLTFAATGCMLQTRSDHTTRVAFTNLPALPAGRAYELWLVPAKGNPVPVGGFVGDSSRGYSGHYTLDAARYPLAAVTVERAPGTSPTPTLPIVITFSLKG